MTCKSGRVHDLLDMYFILARIDKIGYKKFTKEEKWNSKHSLADFTQPSSKIHFKLKTSKPQPSIITISTDVLCTRQNPFEFEFSGNFGIE